MYMGTTSTHQTLASVHVTLLEYSQDMSEVVMYTFSMYHLHLLLKPALRPSLCLMPQPRFSLCHTPSSSV